MKRMTLIKVAMLVAVSCLISINAFAKGPSYQKLDSDFGTCYGKLDALQAHAQGFADKIQGQQDRFVRIQKKVLKGRKDGTMTAKDTGASEQKKTAKEIQGYLKELKSLHSAAQKACKRVTSDLKKTVRLGYE
jgi:hypothetical protein